MKLLFLILAFMVITVKGENVTEEIEDLEAMDVMCNCNLLFVVATWPNPSIEHQLDLSSCGERNEPTRIINGTETAVNEFPWIARLSYFKKFYCAGALLNDMYVLTAAHCIKGFMWFMVKVTLNEHDRCNVTQLPETRFVTKAIAHNFTFATFRDDIALLRVNKPVVMSIVMKPICLPLNDDEIYVGVNATAAGWGSTSELTKNQSCQLLEVDLPIISNEACKATEYESHMISDNMMCAGYPVQGGKDTCQGDSGGPLCADIQGDNKYEVLGVVSWGIGCGRPGYPGVYTRITKYLDWIRENGCPAGFCANTHFKNIKCLRESNV